MKKISIIIPAADEEDWIADAIDSIESQAYPDCEIIVVSNGSRDRTAEIAQAKGARVLVYPKLLGYGGARNAGAKEASGDVLVFLDADSTLGPGALQKIAEFPAWSFGTVTGRPDSRKLRYRLFFGFKNIAHRLGLFKGVLGGCLICSSDLFRAIKGFPAEKVIDEYRLLRKRIYRQNGAYRLIRDVYATTSVRRFEEVGLLGILFFWIRLRLSAVVKSEHKVSARYHVYHKKRQK